MVWPDYEQINKFSGFRYFQLLFFKFVEDRQQWTTTAASAEAAAWCGKIEWTKACSAYGKPIISLHSNALCNFDNVLQIWCEPIQQHRIVWRWRLMWCPGNMRLNYAEWLNQINNPISEFTCFFFGIKVNCIRGALELFVFGLYALPMPSVIAIATEIGYSCTISSLAKQIHTHVRFAGFHCDDDYAKSNR